MRERKSCRTQLTYGPLTPLSLKMRRVRGERKPGNHAYDYSDIVGGNMVWS